MATTGAFNTTTGTIMQQNFDEANRIRLDKNMEPGMKIAALEDINESNKINEAAKQQARDIYNNYKQS